MDLTAVFKRRGFKYKYVYVLGDIGKPESIKMVDAWEKEIMSSEELEKQKREMMKNYKQPVIDVEIVEI